MTNPTRKTVDVLIEFDDAIGETFLRTIVLGSIDCEDDADDYHIFYYSQCETEEALRAAHADFGGDCWRIV